jgi:hypothetical protein
MKDLFDDIQNNFSEWNDMPEFVMEDLTPYRVINVRFRNAEDVAEFEKLMAQRITEKQKTIWFPYAEPRRTSHLRYVDES